VVFTKRVKTISTEGNEEKQRKLNRRKQRKQRYGEWTGVERDGGVFKALDSWLLG
jgi:hypothetical protein